MKHKRRNVQGDKTAYVAPKITLKDNFWPRYDKKHDLPYLADIVAFHRKLRGPGLIERKEIEQ